MKEYPDIEYLGEVIEHSWGQRVIRFYDLDGHIIEVGEEMKMVIKRFLASGMTMEEVSVKMDVSIEDLTKLLLATLLHYSFWRIISYEYTEISK